MIRLIAGRPLAGGRRLVKVLLPGALLALGGCQGYQRAPLDGAALTTQVEERRAQAAPRLVADAPMRLESAAIERVALLLNPGLNVARREAGVAEASAEQAGRWADPVVGAEALRILSPDSGQSPRLYGASLSFTIPISGRLAVEKAQARAEARAGLVAVWRDEQELLRQLRVAFAQWQSETAREQVLAAELADLGRIASLARRLEDAGELSAADGAAYRAAETQGLVYLRVQSGMTALARREVCRLAGLHPETNLEVTDGAVAEHREPAGEPPDLEELAARAPAALLASAEYEAAEQRLRLAVRKQYPDLEIGPLYGREDRQDRVGFGFSLPIPILGGTRRELAEARAAREASRSRWEEAVLTAEADYARALGEWQAAEDRRTLIDSTLLPQTEARLAELQHLLDAGEINALVMLEAFEARREARLDLVAARYEAAGARAWLEALLPVEPNDQLPPTEGAKP